MCKLFGYKEATVAQNTLSQICAHGLKADSLKKSIQDASHDFVSDERVIWVDLEGVPLNMWSRESFLKIGNKWGEALDIKDNSGSSFARKRMCVITKQPDSILEKFKVIYKGRVFLVCAKELFTWTPIFLEPREMVYTSDGEYVHGENKQLGGLQLSDEESNGDSDVDGVPDTVLGDNSFSHHAPRGSSGLRRFFRYAMFIIHVIYAISLSLYPFTERYAQPYFFLCLIRQRGVTPVVYEVHKDDDLANVTTVNGVDNENTSVLNARVMNNSQEVSDSPKAESTSLNSGPIHNSRCILDVLEDMVKVDQSMGYNLEGCMKDIERLGHKSKKEWIKELNYKHKVNFLALQETKLERVTHMDVKLLWGNSNYQFITSDSVGSSVGILCVWEANVFRKDYATVSNNFLAIYGMWLPNNSKILLVVIYALQQLSQKRVLWDYISSLLGRWDGEAIVMGDCNDVRCKEERLGSLFNSLSARVFNRFIESAGLVEVKLEGYSFTWSHPSAAKISKLDRFLVTNGILSLFPSITALCLDRHLSDHRPILLHEVHTDFGPIPFLFYHSWFRLDGFDDMVEHAWHFFSHLDSNGMIRFKKKLQDLRIIIRRWGVFVDGLWCTHPCKVKETFINHFQARFNQPSLGRFKLNSIFTNRLSPDQVVDLDSNVSRDEIRKAVWDCRENKSPSPDGYTFEFFRKIWSFVGLDFCSAVEHFFVNGYFSKGCSSSFIALIPKVTDAKFITDFRPISLIGCVCKVVTKILANRLAMVISDLISDTQSTFVAKRQILDGPFILNELLNWCKKTKKQTMFFKVDFAKAYDSVRWDYLLDVLQAFGFGPNWCRWIRGTFYSARASILVNGSPTSKFSFFRGLKQGDPLSPYLFILIMESLHISFSRAIADGFLNGIKLKGPTISHLFYADDAMFIGEWSESNLKSIVTMLNCFFLASGLKINIQKSQLLGVSVPRSSVAQAAAKIGCVVLHHQFRYLGVMVGECMSRRSAWDGLVHKLRSQLSKWKVKTLSIGGSFSSLQDRDQRSDQDRKILL
nr:RNA-directed DNA polymerase, eukaryota [Tanacetum cinerariifolium]